MKAKTIGSIKGAGNRSLVIHQVEGDIYIVARLDMHTSEMDRVYYQGEDKEKATRIFARNVVEFLAEAKSIKRTLDDCLTDRPL